ncbi:MAG: hypothetical protein Q8L40_06430 [Burkholderiales bacterium]|nr:hypothetical protein [Burkholderiales bacterium]
MNAIRSWGAARLCGYAVAAMLAGCAAPVPRQAQVVTMGAHAPAPAAAFPAEGGIWRMNDSEFRALGPVPVETGPGEADAIPGSFPRPSAESQHYRNYGYVVPLPFFIYYGPRSGFAYRYPGYWPRASHTFHPHQYSRSWRARRR